MPTLAANYAAIGVQVWRYSPYSAHYRYSDVIAAPGEPLHRPSETAHYAHTQTRAAHDNLISYSA